VRSPSHHDARELLLVHVTIYNRPTACTEPDTTETVTDPMVIDHANGLISIVALCGGPSCQSWMMAHRSCGTVTVTVTQDSSAASTGSTNVTSPLN
jgi:hypothetical protein